MDWSSSDRWWQLSTGNLTSMFSYTMTILMSLMMFMMIFVMLSISMASVERINEVLTTKTTIDSQKMGSKKSLMVRSTLKMWLLLIPMKMATRPMSYKGINLSIRSGSDWYLGRNRIRKIKLGAVDSSSLWCRVWSGDSSRPRCQRIRSWFPS